MSIDKLEGDVHLAAINPPIQIGTVTLGGASFPVLRLGHPTQGWLDFLFEPLEAAELAGSLGPVSIGTGQRSEAEKRVEAMLDVINYAALTPTELAARVVSAILNEE